MTEEQYKKLMYALSTIIALEKIRNPTLSVPGISYDEVIQQAEKRLETEAEEVYQNLTGSPSKRGKQHENNRHRL